MAAVRPFSPARSRSTNGTPSSATRLMPTPSSTASFTTPTASISPARASDAGAPDQLQRIDHRLTICQKITPAEAPLNRATSSRNAGRHHLGISGRHRRNPHFHSSRRNRACPPRYGIVYRTRYERRVGSLRAATDVPPGPSWRRLRPRPLIIAHLQPSGLKQV
jgi:hypothetical protein